MKTTEQNVCIECNKIKVETNHWIKENLLPAWFNDNGDAQFHVPKESSILTLAEKMSIQQHQVFLPVHHMRNGTLGLKGHVCSFPQALGEACDTLPRLPKDVSVVKLVKFYEKEIGGGTTTKAFRVRKDVVLAALNWLKKHSVSYQNIKIETNNLNWIDGNEAVLPAALQSRIVINENDVSRS